MAIAGVGVVVAGALGRPIRVVAVAVGVGPVRVGAVVVALAVGTIARDGSRHLQQGSATTH